VDITKSVQGVALYAEFVRSGATTQIIVTPDGFDSEGNKVAMNIVRRTVTTDNPRKQWKFSTLVESDPIMKLVAEGATDDEAKELFTDNRMRYASSLFDQISRGDWLLVGDPIYVEISKTDLDTIRQGKTPTKLLYRITQCRTAVGYPADLVNPEVSTPATV
jgi:hypothetical protein